MASLKIRRLLILISFLMLCLIACSIQEKNDADRSETQAAQIEKNTTSYMEEGNMLEILKKLVDDNYICITKLFYFGHLPYGDVEMDGDVAYAKVISEEFRSISDVKNFLEAIYVVDEVDRLLNYYFEGQPLYFDKGGALYLYLAQASNAGMPMEWKNYSIEIVEQTTERCIFEVTATYNADEFLEGDTEAKYTFVAVNSNGWRLETAESNPHM